MPKMRRQDRQLTTTAAKEILAAGEYGILATVDSEGQPYGVPLSYAYLDDKIYFHCAPAVGHKLANLAANPRVSFTVVGATEVLPAKFSTNYESAIALGIAAPALDETKRRALEVLILKYSPDFIEKGDKYIAGYFDKVDVYEITINQLTAKGRR